MIRRCLATAAVLAVGTVFLLPHQAAAQTYTEPAGGGGTPAPEAAAPPPVTLPDPEALHLIRHQQLLDELSRLVQQGGAEAESVVSLLFRLVPSDDDEPADVRIKSRAARLVEDRIHDRFAELLEVRAALAAMNPGQEFGIGVAVFPVNGPTEYTNSWGSARSGGRRHKGTDVLAAEGTELVAIESGYIERFSNNRLGGLSFYFRGDSGSRYYYAHLSAFGPQQEGEWVDVGTVIGYVGDTGNARGTPHLHFQWAPGGGETWVNPYHLLRALEGTVWPKLDLPPLPEPAPAPAPPVAAAASLPGA